MTEEKLYPMVKDHLEKNGFYPVKITPSIRIRGYKPDVAGLKDKAVQCIEVKPDFNEYSVMAAITQARVYMFGSTHVFIAFPANQWKIPKQKKLRELAQKLCEECGLGIYLIDEENGEIEKIMDAKFSKWFDLHDYDNTIQQLEGKEWIRLENTYPEYIRDLCIYLQTAPSISRKELSEKLYKNFDKNYWLEKSRSQASKDKATKNRIKGAIIGAVELGFISVEPDKDGNENQDILILSYAGKILAKLNEKEINKDKIEKMNEKTKTFFSAYLLRFPIIRMAIDILQENGKTMPVGQSPCKSCDFKHWEIKKFKIKDRKILCPKCNGEINICISHKLQLEYGMREYGWPLNFTKSLYDSLDIFEFPKISRLGGIKLKN
jgi:predicted Zn-ribbon and HTH transcriptional regulator